MRFETATRSSLIANEPALLLAMIDGNLVGGILRKRPDGRFEERAIYAEGSVILALKELPQLKQAECIVKVVIDENAYWPDIFPPLLR